MVKLINIGSNKSGTTSMSKWLSDHGLYAYPEARLYDWYHQATDESDPMECVRMLLDHRMAKHAADVPFSLRDHWLRIANETTDDEIKFILTCRNPKVQAKSIVRVSAQDPSIANVYRNIYGSLRERHIADQILARNSRIATSLLLRHRLFVFNIESHSDPDLKRLAEFAGVKHLGISFPHSNRFQTNSS